MEKQLPKNWVETELGNYAYLKNGYAFKSSDFCNIGIPVIKIANIKDGRIDLDDSMCVDQSIAKTEFSVNKGDILIAMSGATTGKFGLYNLYEVAMQNQRVGNIKPLVDELSHKKFIYYLLFDLKQDIETMAYGGAQPNISPQLISSLRIPLPPLAEQKRIAEKLDVLFGQLDSVRGAMSRIPTLLANLRQQILTHAVTGKLTQEWRQGKAQYDLYDVISNIKSVRIKSNAKSQANKEKIESIYSDDSSSIDFFIPDEWISVNLDKVCMAFSYGTSAKSEEYGKYPVLRMGNIQKGKITWDDLKYTSDDNEFNKYKVNKGDILFNRTNSPELVGKTAIFDTDNDACYAGYIIKITPCIEVNSSYLNIVLNSQYARRWCWENKSDGVSQSNINAQKISKFTIPYPHLSEQKEIVNRVQSLFEKLDSIEQRYQMLKTKLENLPQAILHKAFKGELVEQLPSDGNAADLLREIEQLKKSLKKK